MKNHTTSHNKEYCVSQQKGAYVEIIHLLEEKWQKLCKRYLPMELENSVWRFSRTITPDDPEQGWKIYISATILSADIIFEKVAPFLCHLGILFKAPGSLLELKK